VLAVRHLPPSIITAHATLFLVPFLFSSRLFSSLLFSLLSFRFLYIGYLIQDQEAKSFTRLFLDIACIAVRFPLSAKEGQLTKELRARGISSTIYIKL
jgi:hypothetical protein